MVEPFLRFQYVGGTWALGAYKKEYPSIARYSILHHPYRRKGIPELVDADNYVEIGTGHTLLKRSSILEVGGFPDLKSKEDVDLTYRVAKAGYTFVYVKDCEVYHLHATTFRGFVKKYERDINAGLNEKRNSDGESSGHGGGNSGAILVLHVKYALYILLHYYHGIVKDRDLAWLWHPVICFLQNLLIGVQILLKFKLMKGRKNPKTSNE